MSEIQQTGQIVSNFIHAYCILTMVKYFLLFLFFYASLADCPLNHYPRQTIIGYIQAEINNDPKIHNQSEDYSYVLSDPLPSTDVSVVASVTGFQLDLIDQINFKVKHLSSSSRQRLTFRVSVKDQNYGWRLLKCSFIATRNSLFSMRLEEDIQKFSSGPQEGQYSVYRVIPEFSKFSAEPVVRVFLSGIQAVGRPVDSDETIRNMQNQLSSMKMFGGNPRLIKLLQQSLSIKQGLQFEISNQRTINRLLGFNIETNMEMRSLTFSYVIFSNIILREKHNIISGDFSLVDQNSHRFSILSNMGMLLAGLTQFSIPRSELYSFEISYEERFNQGYFGLVTNKPHFQLGFSYLAVQMKRDYVCQDCQDSPIIFQQNYCVRDCPRGYSEIQRLNNVYCTKCSIDQLKIVDSSGSCVCAQRHFLDNNQDICKPCSYDCLTCTTDSRCQKCDNIFKQTKRTMNSQGRCVCPSTGYYDDSVLEDIVCRKCDKTCKTCNGPRPHDCLTCDSGKELDSFGFCICLKGFEVDQQGKCVCPPPKVLFSGFCTTNSTSCGPNQSSQLVDLTRRCVCNSGYIQILNECIRCEGNSIFDEDQLKCTCINENVYVNNECVPCGPNQMFDHVLGVCKCSPNTFKTDNGDCITCPAKMGYINGKCQCPFNYFERNGKCERCKRASDGAFCRKNYEIIDP